MPSVRTEHGVDGHIITYRCYYHSDAFAVRRCHICSRMICNRCAVYAGYRPVCKICYMRHVLPERAVVFVSTGIKRSDLSHRVISV
ncbi:MAG: hypothetical protein NZ988_02220 [Thaumarchaeota archaeon]|nr:hypothetical protein [Candidatus Calditenuaceae archaeon]MDW8186851.1 hypothetical protein [Nitrososphaerota archaeon]